MSRERALQLRQVLLQAAQSGNAKEFAELAPQYAVQLLNAGNSEDALAEFEKFESFAAKNQISLGPRQRDSLRVLRAICLLRVGEQENCLVNHNADSCLFPIRGGGVHQLPRGSEGALRLLTEEMNQRPNDLRARWLLNVAYMTLGQYPAKVPPTWLIPPEKFASGYDIKPFPDVAMPLGLDVNGLAGGVIMEDFDGDGYLDLMVSDWSLTGQLRYFHNNGDGTFTDRTAEAGLTGLVSGLNLMQTDYNNDGRPDVFIPRGAWVGEAGHYPKSLLRNNGDGTFTDVTEEAGLLSPHPSQTAAWFDYDGDGWLDVFIGNESSNGDVNPCELYHNNHDGTFTECAVRCGLGVNRFIKGVVADDFNHDGRPDLYLSNRDGANLLFRNDGPRAGGNGTNWVFTDVAVQAGVASQRASFPTAFLDYDNDGWPDILVTGYGIRDVGDICADVLGLPHDGERARLYRNNHDGTFKDVTIEVGLYKVIHAMGLNFGDLDNDGWLDFYAGTGDPDLATLIPNLMYRNNGGRTFQDVTTSGGFGMLQKGHGIAFGDLDNDGDQDIYSVVGGAYTGDTAYSQVFLNPGHGNHWITLKLEGKASNRIAIGARIKVNTVEGGKARAIYKTVCTGASFGASPLRQEIGLGQATEITGIEILWPTTGQTQTLKGLPMDHFYKVTEGDAQATPWDVKPVQFNLSARPAHPHHHEPGQLPVLGSP
ncbi:MAG TPA: CRTAC1 family protein [Candidatus Limnocylindria bacterium]|nr:CRTAC1 family protein [Candidatus Limnocylindria bacterium]